MASLALSHVGPAACHWGGCDPHAHLPASDLRPPALASGVCLPPPNITACLPAAGSMHIPRWLGVWEPHHGCWPAAKYREADSTSALHAGLWCRGAVHGRIRSEGRGNAQGYTIHMHHLLSSFCPGVSSSSGRHLSLLAAATSLQISPSLLTLLTQKCHFPACRQESINSMPSECLLLDVCM